MASVAFVERILISSGRLFLVAGVSVDKAMRIVGQYVIDYFMSNYFGLGFAIKCNYNNSPAIKIKYKNQPMKYILFAGGYNNNSQDFIQGSTFNGVYLTEINLLNLDFIQQCLQRVISFKDAFIYGTLNPKGSKDPFYSSFLFRWWREQQEDLRKKWLNYNKFYLEDNPILTPEMIEDAKKGYDPESLRYKRDILCQRVDAEGLIYTIKDYNIINIINPSDYSEYIIVADPGVNCSMTSFVLAAYRADGNGLDIIKEYSHRNADYKECEQKFPQDYANDYLEFFEDSVDIMGKLPKAVLLDRDITFYKCLLSAFRAKGYGTTIIKYVSKEINNDKTIEARINADLALLYKGKLRFYKNCSTTIKSFKEAIYDEKESAKGKLIRYDNPQSDNHIDAIDAVEYAVIYYYNRLFKNTL